ncbi:AAA family ATPase [Brachybacterium sp. AOP3-A1-3]|uniref:AAA family ATPase n=1 Tax=Brachybacterium sp. AOP3-A1-3 TaxID=3457699 RepID=UPI0040348808
MTSRVLVISGASGTGKSTMAEALLEYTTAEWICVEADLSAPQAASSVDFSDREVQQRFAETLLNSVLAWPAAGYDTIIDGLLPYPVSSHHRDVLDRLGSYDLKILAVTASETAIRHRIERRGRGDIEWSLQQLKDIHDGVRADFTLDTTSINLHDTAPLHGVLTWMNSPHPSL